ncbi:hypothetical protein MARPU_08605 [Marichromatium purpuratum 984]|uniref:4-aminobutyrate aminotransferase n=1 Tax=Marichromatium purpuratum 984 TaxID=765910 RepID=W0E3X0_MARPU|nr:DUF5682 family protein [Marichromatium purpuratum]AHF03919.1 hypothetical protein MARPU_08605 [Marichromatium purpuratum 984]
MSTHVFGVRHHGPGSTRSLLDALERLAPDIVLIEGPPEGDALVALAGHARMRPPVAMLVYAPDDPSDASYYPFARFSPEWQAIHYALGRDLPIRFMDLPLANRIALRRREREESAERTAPDASSAEDDGAEPSAEPAEPWRGDPLALIAQAAGYEDSERWWEHMVEERRDTESLFDGIRTVMTALREQVEGELAQAPPILERYREAAMRKILRATEKEGFARIAVVCGAWHVPALEQRPKQSEDNRLLKGLPKVKTTATWVPWTYGRLSYHSGYGAGIGSPGWYDHLWSRSGDVATPWLIKVAQAFRAEGLDISSAHVIESVRLAETLAAMRARPLPSLAELNDATQTVMLFGESAPMQLIQARLIVGERLGQVPESTPATPLQEDLRAQQRRLRLKPSANDQSLVLDLRKPNDLARSHLLHRLRLLDVPWGRNGGREAGKGTFKESWRLKWEPDFEVALIEAGRWGNSIAQAATTAVVQEARRREDIGQLAALARQALLADLGEAIEPVIEQLQARAALAADVLVLMQAVPELARLARYGDVRKTAIERVDTLLDGLLARIFIGLPNACSGLNEEAAETLFEHIQGVHEGLRLLDDTRLQAQWQHTLSQLADTQSLQGIIRGRCCRLLLDTGAMDEEDAARQLGLALSRGNAPGQSAAWLDGFLRDSGQLLIHDHALWQLVDQWVCQLPEETFMQVIPLLRRTFSSFEAAERRQMGERVKRGPVALGSTHDHPGEFDRVRAETTLPLLSRLLGLEDGE